MTLLEFSDLCKQDPSLDDIIKEFKAKCLKVETVDINLYGTIKVKFSVDIFVEHKVITNFLKNLE